MTGQSGQAHQATTGHPRWRLVLLALVLAELAAGLETTLMFAALPAALRGSAQTVQIGWLITGYLLVSAAAAAVCGRLGDLHGRRKVLLVMLGVATAGSVVSSVSSDLHWIVAGRAMQGLSGAVLPLCYGLLRENLPRERLPVGIGIVSAANSFSAAAGFVIGGLIVDHGRWQNIFLCSATLGAAGFIICLVLIPSSQTGDRWPRQDLLGGLLFSPAIALTVLGISELGRGTSDGIFGYGLLGASAVLLILWVLHERGHPNPLIDVRLLADRRIAAANAASIFAGLGALQVLQVFPVLLQQPAWTGMGFGLTATLTGLLKLPSNVASVAGATMGGALCSRVDSRKVMVWAALSSLGAWVFLFVDHRSLWLCVILICFSSAGFTTLFTAVINIVIAAAPPDRTSEATAMTATLRTIAQSIGSQIVSTLYITSVVTSKAGASYPSPAAHHLVLIYMIGASTMAVAAAWSAPVRVAARITGAHNSRYRAPKQ